MTENAAVPRLFALTRDVEKPGQIVGYGMVLPDGSAYSVSWPAGPGAYLYSASSAEETASLRRSDLLWMKPIGDDLLTP